MIQHIAPNQQISLEISGHTDAPALALLHAFPLSSEMWEKQRQFFSPYFRVITPDARGIGSSSPFVQEPSISQMARDLATLMDSLGIEKAVIGGCSMGGYTALEFARQFPDRICGLILCDTRADADSEEGKKGRDEMMAFARQNDGLTVVEKMLPKLLSDTVRSSQPELVQQIKNWVASFSGQRLADLVQALRDRRDSTALLTSIGVPALVIGGALDIPSPPDVMAQMAEHISGSRHIVIGNAAHLSSVEQPGQWNREVWAWLHENDLTGEMK